MSVDRVSGRVDEDVDTSGRSSPPERPDAVKRQAGAEEPVHEGSPRPFASRAEEFAARRASREDAAEYDTAETDPDESAENDSPVEAGGVRVAERPETDAEDAEDTTPRPYAERLDTPIGDDQPTPREVLERFDPARAHLPETSKEQARDYIEQNADQRPWLASAKDRDPAVQRVIAAMDQGQGHALERHEGHADDDKLIRRVTALEDPAQLDPGKRAAGIDGCKPGNKPHRCGVDATAIQDPDAFATAFARGIEHPDVQSVLQKPFEMGKVPRAVSVPVDELLGADGPHYCSGYQLEPVDDSILTAQDFRKSWVRARPIPERESDIPDPRCIPIEGFEGAMIKYLFRPNRERGFYEVATMYVEPPSKSNSKRMDDD